MLGPLLLLLLSLSLSSVTAHEYYNGRCLRFVPMADLDWQKFSGDWLVVFKMNSRSSCVRYNYATSSGGQKLVTEEKLLPVLGRFGVPSAVHSEGTLTTTSPNNAATMTVDWNTGVLGDLMFSDMDYVVLDTDYTSRALVCSCQHFNIGFFAINRRSCDYMIRPSDGEQYPRTIPADYISLLDSVSPDLSLDMKRVRQDTCQRLESDPSLDLGRVWSYGQTIAQMAADFI